MAAIRSRDTKPEVVVRRLLHRLGFRFRLHARDLPGKPDIVFRKREACIFVHGCFWHQHSCPDGHLPISGKGYWYPKLRNNRCRDAANVQKLRRLGWRVLTIWECQLDSLEKLERRLRQFLC
jgi:DNA mismatch endonuclease (patch repair protein)